MYYRGLAFLTGCVISVNDVGVGITSISTPSRHYIFIVYLPQHAVLIVEARIWEFPKIGDPSIVAFIVGSLL